MINNYLHMCLTAYCLEKKGMVNQEQVQTLMDMVEKTIDTFEQHIPKFNVPFTPSITDQEIQNIEVPVMPCVSVRAPSSEPAFDTDYNNIDDLIHTPKTTCYIENPVVNEEEVKDVKEDEEPVEAASASDDVVNVVKEASVVNEEEVKVVVDVVNEVEEPMTSATTSDVNEITFIQHNDAGCTGHYIDVKVNYTAEELQLEPEELLEQFTSNISFCFDTFFDRTVCRDRYKHFQAPVVSVALIKLPPSHLKEGDTTAIKGTVFRVFLQNSEQYYTIKKAVSKESMEFIYNQPRNTDNWEKPQERFEELVQIYEDRYIHPDNMEAFYTMNDMNSIDDFIPNNRRVGLQMYVTKTMQNFDANYRDVISKMFRFSVNIPKSDV